ncbi:MAG: hypothetical protein QOH90_178, partial [Actinomycetota bacterium]|nr:hypothetical protein [Actinomycetota bacterium]
MTTKKSDLVFFSVFGLFLGSAVLWLLLGLSPAVTHLFSGLHEALHEWGAGTGPVAEMAQKIAQASHSVSRGPQVIFDYGFSLFSIALAVLLLRLRPRDNTARLLAVGMLGGAVAFNLQGHDALQVVPFAALSAVDLWHVSLHVASGLAYMFAMLMFPDGRLLGPEGSELKLARIPVLAILALFFTVLSLITVDDHTLGLVVVFGVFIPLAGLSAQARRFVRARDGEKKQQSKVLLAGLTIAFVAALPLIFFTTGSRTSKASVTQRYEITALPEGTYFFRCDPHPDDMWGTVD